MTILQIIEEVARSRGIDEETIVDGNAFASSVDPRGKRMLNREVSKAQEHVWRILIHAMFVTHQNDEDYRKRVGKRIQKMIERN